MTHDRVTGYGNDFLRTDLKAWNIRERATTAGLLVLIAEFDRRKLYRDDGYDSMHAWCVTELNMSDYTAYAYVRTARLSRRFPVILPMLADARLNVTAIVQLKPYLRAGNVEQLLTLAAGQSKAALAALLAQRFPRTESLPLVVCTTAQATVAVMSEQPCTSAPCPAEPEGDLWPATIPAEVPLATVPAPTVRPAVQPIAAARYDVRFTMGQEMQDDLSLACDLAADEVPSGDLAGVFHLALKAYIDAKQKKKFAATERPRPPKCSPKAGSRHIPAHVKRAVWERDSGRCTFVGSGGHRCEARRHLEYAHIAPFANGGPPSVPNIRLRCHAHNQLEAERSFGAEFMRHRRERAIEERRPSG